MIFQARFPSRCFFCTTPIAVGDSVVWHDAPRKVVHAACSPVQRAAEASIEASRATEIRGASLDLPVPDGLAYLPYQRSGIAYALGRPATLFADEMGLGKTVQAIGFLNARPEIRTVCVVCPASLKLNWEREIRRWSSRCIFPKMREKGEKVEKGGVLPLKGEGITITIVNYDLLKKLPEGVVFDLLILDEAHYISNPAAQRSKLATSLAARCRYRLALTGTPIVNRPMDLWPVLQILDPATWDPPGRVKDKKTKAYRQALAGEGAGFFKFAMRYCAAHEVAHGKFSGATHWDFSGASHLDELQDRLRASVMVRRLKADVLTELPLKQRQIIPLAAAHEEDFADLPDDYDAAVALLHAGQVKSRSKAPIPFAEITKRRHDQGLAKVPASIALITEWLESVAKVIVFAHHHDVIDALQAGLAPLGAVRANGADPLSDRQAAVDRFQTDPTCRVIVCGIRAMGVGHTLTAASLVVFVERDWTFAAIVQAEDRAHRIGQRDFVRQLVDSGSIDALLTEALVRKQNIADKALDATKGRS